MRKLRGGKMARDCACNSRHDRLANMPMSCGFPCKIENQRKSLFRHANDVLQLNVRRRTANSYIDLICFHFERTLGRAPIRQSAGIERQADRLGFARPERNALESLQFLNWTFNLRVQMGDVHLHDFLSRARPAISKIETHRDRTVALQAL